MRLLFLTLAALILSTTAVAQVANPANQQKQKELSSWIMNYYKSPAPEKFVEKVKASSEVGRLLSTGPRARKNANVMFLGKVMAANPTQIAGWMDDLKTLPDAEYAVLKKAVWYSGTDAGNAWLKANGESKLADGPRPQLLSNQRAMQMQPADLDSLWEWFFATGEKEPVEKIVSLFSLAHEAPPKDSLALLSPPKKPTQKDIDAFKNQKADGKKVDPATLYRLQSSNFRLVGPGIWSTSSLASRHDRVLEILEAAYAKKQRPRIKAWLGQIIKVAKTRRAKAAS